MRFLTVLPLLAALAVSTPTADWQARQVLKRQTDVTNPGTYTVTPSTYDCELTTLTDCDDGQCTYQCTAEGASSCGPETPNCSCCVAVRALQDTSCLSVSCQNLYYAPKQLLTGFFSQVARTTVKLLPTARHNL